MTAAKPAGTNRALTAARNRYAADELKAAAARGATQYVIIGAGLDMYAYRNQNANLRLFVAADLEDRTLQSALEGAGFRPGETAFFSWLGVAPYASPQATMETLAYIGSMAPGSGLIFDYTSRRLLSDPAIDPVEETAMDALASRLADDAESIQLLVDPRALGKLLRSVGFHQIEDLGPAEIDERYFGDGADGPRVWPGSVHFVSARI
jgi:O-methyltransferase involved in polyketide biosynthesis